MGNCPEGTEHDPSAPWNVETYKIHYEAYLVPLFGEDEEPKTIRDTYWFEASPHSFSDRDSLMEAAEQEIRDLLYDPNWEIDELYIY